jgi:hypothetical protein
MSKQVEEAFNLSTGVEKSFSGGGNRQDIKVDGAVLVIVEANGVDKTVDTITDTGKNFYWSGPFKLEATGGTAIGSVTSVGE